MEYGNHIDTKIFSSKFSDKQLKVQCSLLQNFMSLDLLALLEDFLPQVSLNLATTCLPLLLTPLVELTLCWATALKKNIHKNSKLVKWLIRIFFGVFSFAMINIK